MEAFVNLDELLARQARMVVKELDNPSDGKRFEVSLSQSVRPLAQFFNSG